MLFQQNIQSTSTTLAHDDMPTLSDHDAAAQVAAVLSADGMNEVETCSLALSKNGCRQVSHSQQVVALGHPSTSIEYTSSKSKTLVLMRSVYSVYSMAGATAIMLVTAMAQQLMLAYAGALPYVASMHITINICPVSLSAA